MNLVQRLRATHDTVPASEDWRLCAEAADEIERLRAEVKKLRESDIFGNDALLD